MKKHNAMQAQGFAGFLLRPADSIRGLAFVRCLDDAEVRRRLDLANTAVRKDFVVFYVAPIQRRRRDKR